MYTRRALILASLAGGVVGPLRCLAQQPGKTWRVGILSARGRPASLATDYYGAFPQEMRALGYREGANLAIEWRFAGGEYGRLAGMATELVQLKPDAILALGPPAIVEAQKATAVIAIVMVSSVDPVGAGFVKSLARPGGNVTGLFNLGVDLSAKHLEMLVAAVPQLSRVALLVNPANPAHGKLIDNVAAAARQAGVDIVPVKAQSPQQIESAFSIIGQEKARALIVALDPLFIQQGSQIATQAAAHRLPSIFANREYAEAGGFMSYGQNQAEIYRRAALYVDRIFKGARPADLPVEQPAVLELVINGATARALGITIPQSVLVRADKIIP